MSAIAKISVTVVLLLLLGGLAASDYYFSDRELAADITDGTSSSSIGDIVDVSQMPSQGVARNQGPIVETVIAELGLTTQTSEELTILAQVSVTGATLQSLTILKDNDRAGSVSWIQTPDVKNVFAALKEALLAAFTPDLQGLRDETLQSPNTPVRDMLSFFDPGLSEESLVFVRVRDRLYEFHITETSRETMNGLIETLTTR